MRVLVADSFEQSGLDALAAGGCELVYEPALSGDALTAALAASRPDVLVVRSTRVTAPMLEAGTLRLIVRAGAGVNTIDVAAAGARGIAVSNCPGKNAIAVAELTFALILALDRRVPDNVAALRAGQWNKKGFSKARGLYGRTLGLLGFGHVGQEVARRGAAFGMPVVVWSRRFTDAGHRLEEPVVPGVAVATSPESVVDQCDVLSLHLALTPETKGLVNAALLGRLKHGSILINTARAELVDAAALREAVVARELKVGLDVFPDEPLEGAAPYTAPLVDLPQVYGTHHIGASTEQAQEAVAAETVRIITAFKDRGEVPNRVGVPAR
jgi:D-3-phosphoglycerate dehydrogenase